MALGQFESHSSQKPKISNTGSDAYNLKKKVLRVLAPFLALGVVGGAVDSAKASPIKLESGPGAQQQMSAIPNGLAGVSYDSTITINNDPELAKFDYKSVVDNEGKSIERAKFDAVMRFHAQHLGDLKVKFDSPDSPTGTLIFDSETLASAGFDSQQLKLLESLLNQSHDLTDQQKSMLDYGFQFDASVYGGVADLHEFTQNPMKGWYIELDGQRISAQQFSVYATHLAEYTELHDGELQPKQNLDTFTSAIIQKILDKNSQQYDKNQVDLGSK